MNDRELLLAKKIEDAYEEAMRSYANALELQRVVVEETPEENYYVDLYFRFGKFRWFDVDILSEFAEDYKLTDLRTSNRTIIATFYLKRLKPKAV